MNTSFKALAGLALASMCGTAAALPIVAVDAINPLSPVTITTSTPYTITHDITDNGYVLGAGTISSASLSILLTDNAGQEDYSVSIGNGIQLFEYTQNINSGNNTILNLTLNAASLADLMADGKLGISLAASRGDYQFVSSTLTAQVTPVPEPELLAMLTSGLLLVGVMKHRQRKG